ncbi:MAG: hypothetical protein U1D30_20660 [Planctomycetota bacterium]
MGSANAFIVRMAAPPPPKVADPDTVRRVARDVLSGPDYDLDPNIGSGETFLSIFLDYLEMVLRPILRWFDALFDISPFLGYSAMIALVLTALFLLGHIGYTLWVLLQKKSQLRSFSSNGVKKGTDPEQLERLAALAVEDEDFISAVRLLFKASLLRIEAAEKREFRAGLTNRELLRRFRNTPMQAPLRHFVDVIDAKWYGFGTCLRPDFESCREAHAQILLNTKGARMLSPRMVIVVAVLVAVASSLVPPSVCSRPWTMAVRVSTPMASAPTDNGGSTRLSKGSAFPSNE